MTIQTAFLSSYKDFWSNQDSFFRFSFSIYKMVDSEYSSDKCKTLKISIGAIMEDPKMLRKFF